MSHETARDVLRRDLRACLDAAIGAVEPERLVTDFLRAAGTSASIDSVERVWIAGIGKAAAAMARGAVAVLGERVVGGALVVPADLREQAPENLEVFCGGHPIPNQEGVAGADAIRRLAGEAAAVAKGASPSSENARDLFLVLISGGGSALMTLPAAGLALEDVQATTTALLRAGAEIGELNAVRKHLDQLKGGQLARAAAPARVLALVLSDVVGDPVDVIASGPMSPDPSTFASAIEILKRREVWSGVPESVRMHLESGLEGEIAETPGAGDQCFRNCRVHIVGNNRMAAEAACAAAEQLGYDVQLSSTSITGEAREVGRDLAHTALGIAGDEARRNCPVCVVSAGETTVTVTGTGTGGRNQEVALAAAIGLDVASRDAGEEARSVRQIVIASMGTDGIDGPTDAAGAIAALDTQARARAQGLDAHAALADNDSYPFFEALGDLIITGATGTNVMDLHVVLVGRG